MKEIKIQISIIIILFIIFLNCQQTGGSGGGGGKGGGGDEDTPSKWANQLKIIASDAAENDCFGESVSISGDYAIVGTSSKDNGRGAAYIYHRTGTNTWDEGFKIMAFDAADDDQFGYSVSISGDYAIVGALYEDGAVADNRGAVYFFHRTETNIWGEVTKMIVPDAEDDDWFGWSVSISGDYAIVGAPYEDGAGTDRGAVYIYRRIGPDNIWGDVTREIAFDDADGDRFGKSVSISGDYVIIGAPDKLEGRGAAYIFHKFGGTNVWDEGTRIVQTDSGSGNLFGCSVSISGEYAIVGAYRTGSFKGAVYTFHRTEIGANTWDTGTKLVAFDMEDDDFFGESVSISGDYAIVGANRKSGNRGAAYIYHRTVTNIWNTGIKILASDADENDRFGNSVSISGDYAIIGAYGEDSGGINSGAAYIFK